MFRSAMWTSVIQTIVLYALCEIIAYHLADKCLHQHMPDWDHLQAPDNSISQHDLLFKRKESFYFSSLPRGIVSGAPVVIFCYIWHIWLEKKLPSRPKGRATSPNTTELETIEENEHVEEKIVMKWISQGKVQRSSINWRNTLLKWLLHISIGNFVACMLTMLTEELSDLHPPALVITKITEKFSLHAVVIRYSMLVFSPSSLAVLICFIIVPAYKRIVFLAGFDLLCIIFLLGVLNVVVPWLMTLESVQEIVRVSAEAARNGSFTLNNQSLHEHEL